MDIQNFLDHIRDLTDLELALLLSLIAQQNILISTPESLIDDLATELSLIASEIFNLSYAVISLDDATSVDAFGEAILDQNPDHDFANANNLPVSSLDDYHVNPHSRLASVSVRAGSIAPSSHRAGAHDHLDTRTVANIVVAKNFNHAPRAVQIAALELITRRRIYSRTTVHQVPRVFVFVPLVATDVDTDLDVGNLGRVRLNEHLNDRIGFSHYHDPEDGFANLEELGDAGAGAGGGGYGNGNGNGGFSKSATSLSSHESSTNQSHRLHHPAKFSSVSMTMTTSTTRQIPHSLITHLRALGDSVIVTPEIRRYTQDIIVFLRFARGVDGGVTPFATTQLVKLAKYLAPLHGVDFVTPSLVALAVRKVFSHRIVMATPDRERSLQWGGDLKVAEKMIGRLTSETIIEDVLATVPSPV